MMKRKVNMILTFLFLSLCSFSAQASDEVLLIDDTAVEADDDFRANYTVEIPKSIYMQKSEINNTFEANYTVKVTNLDSSDERSCLVIEPDAEFELSAENKKPIKVYVEQEETEFSNLLQDDLSVMHTTIGYLYTQEPLSSAEWKGSFSFNISMVDLGISSTTMAYMLEATPSNAEKVVPDEVVIEEVTNPETDINIDLEIEIATPSNAEKVEIEVVESGNKNGEEDLPDNRLDEDDDSNDEIETEDSEEDFDDEYEEEDADIATDSNASKSDEAEPDNTEDSLDNENQPDSDFEADLDDDELTEENQEEPDNTQSNIDGSGGVIANVPNEDEEDDETESSTEESEPEPSNQETETEDCNDENYSVASPSNAERE